MDTDKVDPHTTDGWMELQPMGNMSDRKVVAILDRMPHWQDISVLAASAHISVQQ